MNKTNITSYNDNGERHGYWEVYHKNGVLDYKGLYVDYNRHGYWEEYFSDGNLYFKGYYNMGHKGNGLWTETDVRDDNNVFWDTVYIYYIT